MSIVLGHQAMAADGSPQMAMGLIVKLKDAKPASVVRLRPAMRPADPAWRQRDRLAGATRRMRISYLVQKPTAFAAHVIHSRHAITMADAQAQAARLRKDPDVEWVVVNEILKPATVTGRTVGIPSDPSYVDQTWLRARGVSTLGVADFPAAWALMAGRTLTPVVTAVLDTGVLYSPDLDGRLLPGYDFVSEVDVSRDDNGLDADPSDPGNWLTSGEKAAQPEYYADCQVSNSTWHGLAITSMLAAEYNNLEKGAGMLAPLPGQVVLPVRVASACGANVSDLLEGMLWAGGVDYQGSPARNPNPARVINISFGGDGSCADTTAGSTSWLYTQVVATLKNKGVLVVASAGNGDSDTGLGLALPTRPASCQGVLAVTALNQQGFKAIYANLVDGTRQSAQHWSLAVAGGDAGDDRIVTESNAGITGPAGFEMKALAGTSFSSPTAAGVAALMMSIDPSLTVDDVLSLITSNVAAFPSNGGYSACTASNLGNCNCTNTTCGSGVLDAGLAVQAAIDHLALNHAAVDSPELSASYFTPYRLQPAPAPTSGKSGGGGVDVLELLALVLAVVIAAVARFKSGKP
ncbi:MAG: S8 family serine peptidase [Aquabacterium sp.]|nr:S8 family serine peptidase [Aquabacterium sp.]